MSEEEGQSANLDTVIVLHIVTQFTELGNSTLMIFVYGLLLLNLIPSHLGDVKRCNNRWEGISQIMASICHKYFDKNNEIFICR